MSTLILTDDYFHMLESLEFRSDKLMEIHKIVLDLKNYAPSPLVWGILIVSIIVLVTKFYYFQDSGAKKVKLILLAHSTFVQTQYKMSSEVLNKFSVEYFDLDLHTYISCLPSYQDMSPIIKKQDLMIDSFMKEINNDDIFGYVGIAHTPLIFRAGYRIGDETNMMLFHKNRNEYAYKGLNHNDSFPKLLVERELIDDTATEMLVSVATTFSINDKDLEVFQLDNKSIIKLWTDAFGFDVIQSQNQVDEYVSIIMKKLRHITENRTIEKVHLVLATSVSMTFALGRSVSKNYDPEIIVYHYDATTSSKYPWGISIFKNSSDSLVINEKLL